MTSRPLSPPMQKALAALLRGPLTRAHDKFFGDGLQAQDKSMHALSVVRALHERGLTLPLTRMAVLSIAGRQEAQRIAKVAA